jgi:hypothetical protein
VIDPRDPLGRIAQHSAEPYPHPRVDDEAMRQYWERVFAAAAATLSPDDLAREHAAAVEDLASCEADIVDAGEAAQSLALRANSVRRTATDVFAWDDAVALTDAAAR